MIDPSKMQQIRVEFSNGIGGDTNIMVGDDIKPVGQTFIYSQKEFKTFSLNHKGVPAVGSAFIIPEKRFTRDWYIVELDNGYKFKCIGSTRVLYKEKEAGVYKLASNLKEGDVLVGCYSQFGSTEIKPCDIKVDKITHKNLVIEDQVYHFLAQAGNIMLPFYNGSEKVFTMVNIGQ